MLTEHFGTNNFYLEKKLLQYTVFTYWAGSGTGRFEKSDLDKNPIRIRNTGAEPTVLESLVADT
jgi:hypothetical protein